MVDMGHGRGRGSQSKLRDRNGSCIYCNTKHKIKQCPAFGMQCSKCHKLNHFQNICMSSKDICSQSRSRDQSKSRNQSQNHYNKGKGRKFHKGQFDDWDASYAVYHESRRENFEQQHYDSVSIVSYTNTLDLHFDNSTVFFHSMNVGNVVCIDTT